MYRLLIVDDEEYITDGVAEILEESTVVELDIYKAYSGIEALEFLKSNRMDIIISDICMPGMDGLKLMEEARSRWPLCRIILLTGHNEFDYVYKAIQYDGVGYILKTEGYEKIIATVENAVEALEQEIRRDEILHKAENQIILASELGKKEYMNAIIRGIDRLPELRQQQFEKMEIPLDNYRDLILLIGRLDDLPLDLSYSEKTLQIYSARLICEEFFPNNVCSIYFDDGQDNLIWMVQATNMDKNNRNVASEFSWDDLIMTLRGNLELVQLSCRKSIERSISFVITDKPFGWDDLAEKYSALKQLLEHNLGTGGGIILTERNLQENNDENYALYQRLKALSNENILMTLENLLETGQADKFFSIFNELGAELSKIKSMNSGIAQKAYYSVALVFLEHINRWSLTEKISFKTGLYRLTRIDENDSWLKAVDYLKKLAEILFDIREEEKGHKTQDIIESIERFINENLGGDLSIIRIADVVYFNPSYLSRLFKQIKGISISEYINSARIKKAKELLHNPTLRINKIAEKVGYASANNFTRFFRKVIGLTPEEYRDSQMR